MSLTVKKTLVLLSFLGSFSSLFAQRWEIGAGGGVLSYKGDVMPTYKPFVVRPGANAFVRMNYSRSLSIKAQGMIGKVHGDDNLVNDPLHHSREFSFDANIIEAGGQIEYNFLNFRTNASRIVNNWTPYVFGGAGVSMIKSKSQRKIDINPSVFSAYAPNQIREQYYSIGIGFKKQWRSQWNWGIEFGARRVNSDFLDTFGYYPDGSYPLNIPTNINTTDPKFQYLLKYQVPNTKVRDMYYYTNFSISYLFYKIHCPPSRR